MNTDLTPWRKCVRCKGVLAEPCFRGAGRVCLGCQANGPEEERKARVRHRIARLERELAHLRASLTV